MKWKEQARRRFSTSADANKWSDIYTSSEPNVEAVSFRKRRNYTVDYILEHIPEKSVILDLGCGAGPVLTQLQSHNYDLTGIDYSHDMLLHAHRELDQNISEVLLIRAECEKVPMTDESFDFVVCLGVISYAESIDAAIKELYRVLKPGGRVIVTYRNKYNDVFLDPVKLIKYLITLPFAFMLTEKKVIGRSIPRQEVLSSIKKCSFIIEKEHQIGFGNIRINGKTISDGNFTFF